MNKTLDTLFYLSNKILRQYPFCHSRPDRSLSYHGRYFGLCARCTGMYTSGILTVLVVFVGSITIAPITSMMVGILLLAPGGIDGTTQLIGDRESTNSLRILTGLLLGVGVVLFMDGLVRLLFSMVV